jgi:hypothetical protein
VVSFEACLWASTSWTWSPTRFHSNYIFAGFVAVDFVVVVDAADFVVVEQEERQQSLRQLERLLVVVVDFDR